MGGGPWAPLVAAAAQQEAPSPACRGWRVGPESAGSSSSTTDNVGVDAASKVSSNGRASLSGPTGGPQGGPQQRKRGFVKVRGVYAVPAPSDAAGNQTEQQQQQQQNACGAATPAAATWGGPLASQLLPEEARKQQGQQQRQQEQQQRQQQQQQQEHRKPRGAQVREGGR